LRQNSKYHVSVTSHGYEEPKKLELAIKAEDDKDDQGLKKVVTLKGDETQIIEFDVSYRFMTHPRISQHYFSFLFSAKKSNRWKLFLASKIAR
jgi:hypothetical protein